MINDAKSERAEDEGCRLGRAAGTKTEGGPWLSRGLQSRPDKAQRAPHTTAATPALASAEQPYLPTPPGPRRGEHPSLDALPLSAPSTLRSAALYRSPARRSLTHPH